MDSAVWQLRGSQASFGAGPLSVSLELDWPQRGLKPGKPGHKGLYLGVGLMDPPDTAVPANCKIPVQDAYVRGRDLVAVYEQTPTRPYRTTLYWHALSPKSAPGALLAIELMVSVQTSLLDSQPTLEVRSALRTDEQLAADADGHFVVLDSAGAAESNEAARCVLARLQGSDISYLEMLHPTAFADSLIKPDGGKEMGLRHRLFCPAELEKGVILRARLRAIWLPRAGDSEAAAGYYRSFLASPTPLTT